MEHFKKLAGHDWAFTESLGEVPDKFRQLVFGDCGYDPSSEPLIGLAYTDSFGVKGQLYVLVTRDRVIARHVDTRHDCRFDQIAGIERTGGGSIALLVAGRKRALFSRLMIPKMELTDRLFVLMDTRWRAIVAAGTSAGVTNPVPTGTPTPGTDTTTHQSMPVAVVPPSPAPVVSPSRVAPSAPQRQAKKAWYARKWVLGTFGVLILMIVFANVQGGGAGLVIPGEQYRLSEDNLALMVRPLETITKREVERYLVTTLGKGDLIEVIKIENGWFEVDLVRPDDGVAILHGWILGSTLVGAAVEVEAPQ